MLMSSVKQQNTELFCLILHSHTDSMQVRSCGDPPEIHLWLYFDLMLALIFILN